MPEFSVVVDREDRGGFHEGEWAYALNIPLGGQSRILPPPNRPSYFNFGALIDFRVQINQMKIGHTTHLKQI